MSSKIVPLECECGSIKGELTVVPKSFFHVHCLCKDCQRFAAHLGNEDKILDQHGGSELFQTYPAHVRLSEGHNNIGCVQLHEKGLYRWHSTCCSMPVANTMSSDSIPFVGISVKFMKFETEQDKLDALGPVTMKAFGKYAIGDMPKDVHPKFPLSYMPKIIGFMIKGMLRKKNNPSPFYDNSNPISKAETLF